MNYLAFNILARKKQIRLCSDMLMFLGRPVQIGSCLVVQTDRLSGVLFGGAYMVL